MIQSMTGFATKTLTLPVGKNEHVNISVSIKSLNSRFFEASCRLPYALSSLETNIVRLLKKKLLRGHVYCTVHMNNPSAFSGDIEPALGLIEDYIDAINTIKKRFDITQHVTLDNILRLPNIFNSQDQGVDETTSQHILAAIQEASTAVIEDRDREGKALRDDLEKRVAFMEKEIEHIAKESQRAIEDQKARVQEAITQIEGDASELAETRKNALYAVLDKIDIHEEIVRFKSHLESLSAQLSSAEKEKGRRIDFTLQELAREINTITAKCSDASIGSLAINIKVEIEKAREQAQNIV